jgi:hypothetical protein
VANVLGVIGIFVFIACVIALAAGATWLVVKISPTKTTPDSTPKPD